MTSLPERRVVTGHYAGPISRAIAMVIDVAASGASFAVGSAAIVWVAETMFGVGMTRDRTGPVWIGVFVVWLFVYYWTGLALVGKTPGKTVVGLRVVTRVGAPLAPGRAALRVLMMAVSFAVVGLGLIGALVGRERRTLHDVVAGTVVVYDWGTRSAELPTFISSWLDRRTLDEQAPSDAATTSASASAEVDSAPST